jgi:alanyl-tRNA synthetase
MQAEDESRREQAAEHVTRAHTLLKALQEEIGEHPELGQAINKLEMALAILGVQTGGML